MNKFFIPLGTNLGPRKSSNWHSIMKYFNHLDTLQEPYFFCTSTSEQWPDKNGVQIYNSKREQRNKLFIYIFSDFLWSLLTIHPNIPKEFISDSILINVSLRDPVELRCNWWRPRRTYEDRGQGWIQFIELIIAGVWFPDHWRSASSQLWLASTISNYICNQSCWGGQIDCTKSSAWYVSESLLPNLTSVLYKKREKVKLIIILQRLACFN